MEVTYTVVLLRLCVQFLALPVYLLWYVGVWGPLCKRAFPYLMVFFSAHYNKNMAAQKKKLFSNLKDFADSKGELRLLELGTGTGTNFQFYPAGCRLICTEPNPHFKKYLDKSLSENGHLHLQQCLVAQGENLHQISDASVDVVVCTLVLCSVASTDEVLKEVLRVLRPGGAFFFIEHVAGAPSSWSLFWQQICEQTWKILFDGCNLSRESWKNLEKAGFSDLHLKHICAPLEYKPIQPHIVGYAMK